MISFDVVHPPAVSTSLSFALRAEDESNLALFAMATIITATLIVLQKATVRILGHYNRKDPGHEE
jgi:hypothetical protein